MLPLPASLEDASDVELLSLIVGDRGCSSRVLEVWPLERLTKAGPVELASVGVDDPTALRMKAALELGRRSLAAPLRRGQQLRTPKEVARHLRGRLLGLEHEQLHVIGVDASNRILVHAIAGSGQSNLVYANPADVFRPLVREAAHGAIVAHNHPAGGCQPSRDDVELTGRLAEASAILGITLLDHVILARSGIFSFAERGMLSATSGTK
jgi:DNA repair protein RadC